MRSTATTDRQVGDIFTTTDDRAWTDAEGGKHTHHLVCSHRVTEAGRRSYRYECVDILEENDRPPFVTDPSTGGQALQPSAIANIR